MGSRLDAVLFDLDGTLVDSLPALRSAYDDFLAAHGRVGSDEEFDRWKGPPLSEVVAGIVAAHRIDGDRQQLLSRYSALVGERYQRDARIAPGVAEVLALLDDKRVAAGIVTSAPSALARSLLEARGLGTRFGALVGGDEVAHGKPSGDGYREAARRLGAAIDRTIAVEDSPAGVTAAGDAGLRCIGIGAPAAHHPLRAVGAIACVTGMNELRALVAGLLESGGRVVPGRTIEVTCVGDAPPLDAGAEREVLRRWEAARRDKPTLTDGIVLSVREWRDEGSAISVVTERIPYRRFVAQRSGQRLGVCPLGVSGVCVVGERIVLGRRARFVTQYPGCWELVPSGGVPAARVRPDGSVDVEGQLLDELDEELGHAATAFGIAPLGLVEDLQEGGVDLCYRIAVGADAEKIRSGIAASGEYEAVELCRPSEAVARAASEEMVPTVPAIIALLSGRPG